MVVVNGFLPRLVQMHGDFKFGSGDRKDSSLFVMGLCVDFDCVRRACGVAGGSALHKCGAGKVSAWVRATRKYLSGTPQRVPNAS
jgi:hypothetical protein